LADQVGHQLFVGDFHQIPWGDVGDSLIGHFVQERAQQNKAILLLAALLEHLGAQILLEEMARFHVVIRSVLEIFIKACVRVVFTSNLKLEAHQLKHGVSAHRAGVGLYIARQVDELCGGVSPNQSREHRC
jgi:hypothetical protein